MDPAVQQDAAHALASIAERHVSYDIAERYYNGDHPLVFASEKFRSTFGNRFRAFSDNLCAAVVDAVSDRLHVTGWNGTPAAVELAQELWKGSRMPRQAGEIHLEAVRAGDAYLLVWPDANGVVRMYAHEAEHCFVGYDEELPGVVRYAVKTWRSGKSTRMNMYYPDRIERYVANTPNGGAPQDMKKWQQFDADGQGAVVVNPYGVVPVFHFASNGELGSSGRSELVNVAPLQDALNKVIADQLVAMEYHAMPLRYRIGVEPPIDPYTGKPVAPKQGPGVLWDLGEGATVGQFPAGDFTPFLAAADSLRAEIARVSRTPMHLLGLSGQNYPSGEALRVAERPLADKVRDRQVSFGDAWADAMSLAVRMAGGPDERIEPVWAPAETVSETEQLNNAVIKEQVGFSRRQVLLDLGITPDAVDLMLAEADAQQASLGDQLLQSFNSGKP